MTIIPNRYPSNQSWNTLAKEQQAYAAKVLAVHSSRIEEIDNSVGRKIQYLKDIVQYINTFNMFASDNGTSEPVGRDAFKYPSGVNVRNVIQCLGIINNSFRNLSKPTPDFNYESLASYVAASPFFGFNGGFYKGGVSIPFMIKELRETIAALKWPAAT